MEKITLRKAANTLEVLNNYTSKEVLTQFELKLKNTEDKSQLIEEKNFLLKNLIEMQMKKRHFFKINSPFKNTCKVCNGTGEIYKFNKKMIEVKCPECDGEGSKEIKCPQCKGVGRFVKRWKSGGGINVECKHCHGTKVIKVKCIDCHSTGKIKKLVPDHKIKDTTPCSKCKGIGFITKPKKKKVYNAPKNPVIPSDMVINIQ